MKAPEFESVVLAVNEGSAPPGGGPPLRGLLTGSLRRADAPTLLPPGRAKRRRHAALRRRDIDGEWVALLTWGAASYKLEHREDWIGCGVGLAPAGGDLVEVRFANLLLGHLEPKTASFRPVTQSASIVKAAKTRKTRKNSPAGEAPPCGQGEASDKPEVSGLSCNLKTNPEE